MVYRRGTRPGFTFQAKTRTGWRQMGCETPDKALAQKIEAMWSDLAVKERAWDVLEKVRPQRMKEPPPGTFTIGELYDWWLESRRNVAALRRRVNDQDIEPLVEPWNVWLASQRGADWTQHALNYVRGLVPQGQPRMASSVTDTWLTNELAKIPLARNTLRKIHSAWSSYFGYCASVGKAFDANPMDKVVRGERQKFPPRFYDGETVERIVAWQPVAVRRAFFALVYGTAADVSPAVAIERADVNPSTKEVRIAGTKTFARDRIVRVADWAWPIFWEHAKTVLHGRIFEGFDRWTVSDWHRQAIGIGCKNPSGKVVWPGLQLSKRLPLRMARHHYAVRMLSAGTPAKVVAEQLGSDERTVLEYYGPWVPTGADRDKWERVATKHESAKRRAN
jgi:integrase